MREEEETDERSSGLGTGSVVRYGYAGQGHTDLPYEQPKRSQQTCVRKFAPTKPEAPVTTIGRSLSCANADSLTARAPCALKHPAACLRRGDRRR